MVAIKQYPYVLKAEFPNDDSTFDSDGNIISSEPKFVEYKCRYQPNTGAKVINTVDGQTVVYKGTAYIDGKDVELATGDTVEIIGFVKGVILQVYKAQFRTRVIL